MLHINTCLVCSDLFFDSESRAIQSAANADDDAQQAESLSLSVRLCQILNRIQTTDAAGRPMDPSARNPAVPPELPPRMFSVPDKQTVVPGVRPPEARSDLVELARMVNDHVCASMGVPASVVFEGKFSSNSMSQLQLCAAHALCPHIRVLKRPFLCRRLNTTVTSLSLHVNRVLTAAYHAWCGTRLAIVVHLPQPRPVTVIRPRAALRMRKRKTSYVYSRRRSRAPKRSSTSSRRRSSTSRRPCRPRCTRWAAPPRRLQAP